MAIYIASDTCFNIVDPVHVCGVRNQTRATFGILYMTSIECTPKCLHFLTFDRSYVTCVCNGIFHTVCIVLHFVYILINASYILQHIFFDWPLSKITKRNNSIWGNLDFVKQTHTHSLNLHATITCDAFWMKYNLSFFLFSFF